MIHRKSRKSQYKYCLPTFNNKTRTPEEIRAIFNQKYPDQPSVSYSTNKTEANSIPDKRFYILVAFHVYRHRH